MFGMFTGNWLDGDMNQIYQVTELADIFDTMNLVIKHQIDE